MFVPIWDSTILFWNIGDFFGWNNQAPQSSILGEAATGLMVCMIIWLCFSLIKRLTSAQREVALILLLLVLLSLSKPIASYFSGIAYTIRRWRYKLMRARLNLLRMGERISRNLSGALRNEVLFSRLAGWLLAVFLVSLILLFIMLISDPDAAFSRVVFLFKDLLLACILIAMLLRLTRRLFPKPQPSYSPHYSGYDLWNLWSLVRFFQIV